MKERSFSKKNRLYFIFIIIALFLFYKCPYSYIFGISCPGCGMTRAFYSILKLDFEGAFYYHPLWWVVVLGIGYYAANRLFGIGFSKKYEQNLLYVIVILFVGVYLIRIFMGHDIVSFHFQTSLINKILTIISK